MLRPHLFHRILNPDRYSAHVLSAKCGLLLCIAITCHLGIATQANGQITNWTGATDTDFFDASNWDNGVPTSSHDARLSLPGANTVDLGFGTASSDRFVVSSESTVNGSPGSLYLMNTFDFRSPLEIAGLELKTDVGTFTGNADVTLSTGAKIDAQQFIELFDGGDLRMENSSLVADSMSLATDATVLIDSGSTVNLNTLRIGNTRFANWAAIGDVEVKLGGILTTSLLQIGGDNDIETRAVVAAHAFGRLNSDTTVISATTTDALDSAGVAIYNKGTWTNSGALTVGNSTHSNPLNYVGITDNSVASIGGPVNVFF